MARYRSTREGHWHPELDGVGFAGSTPLAPTDAPLRPQCAVHAKAPVHAQAHLGLACRPACLHAGSSAQSVATARIMTPGLRCKEVPMGDQRETRSGRCDRSSARRAPTRRPGRPAEPGSLSRFRRARLPLVSSPRRSGPSRDHGVIAALAEVIRDAIEAERVNTIGSASPADGITIPGPKPTTPPDGHPFDPTAP
jgi:hypothetical protein